MFAPGAAVVKLNSKESMVTVHGKGAIKRKIPGYIDYKPGGHPDSINRGPAGLLVVGSRRRGWGVLSGDGIRESQRGELSSEPTGSHISIVVDANYNVIPSFQRGSNSREKICIKD